MYIPTKMYIPLNQLVSIYLIIIYTLSAKENIVYFPQQNIIVYTTPSNMVTSKYGLLHTKKSLYSRKENGRCDRTFF